MEERLLVFVSSAINELSEERRVVKEAIESIPLTRPWLFELSPASVDSIEESYLRKVRTCDLFILILGNYLTAAVLKEWQTAMASGKPRLVFIKNEARSLEAQAFMQSIDVRWAGFADLEELKIQVQHAVTTELINGYRRYSLGQQDTVFLNEFLKLLQENLSAILGQQVSHETYFHAPVTGPIHTGSGDINISMMQFKESKHER